MKRALSLFFALALGLPTALPALAATPAPGSLIKASGPAVYYYNAAGTRYVFPNEKTYFTWYTDFSSVVTITDEELAAISIGGNVTYRPGVRLVKITTDPKVYAVDGTELRWVTSEALAAELFGTTWAAHIDDIPDPFFINYTVGANITAASDFAPTAVRDATPTIQHLIDGVTVTPEPEPEPEPTPTEEIPLTFTANKTEAQVLEQVEFVAQTTLLEGMANIKILLNDTLLTGCSASICSVAWSVPAAGVQSSYTFRALLTLEDGRTTEKTVTVTIVSMPLSPLITVTANRLTLKPNQYPDLRAKVELGLVPARTDIYINGVSVKACTTTPYDCPYNDYLIGDIGSIYEVYAVVETEGQLFYKSETITITIAENDAPAITLTPGLSTVPPGGTVGITLEATDDDGIGTVEIIYDGTLLKTCLGPMPCTAVTGPWNVPSGTTLTFTGNAWDLQGTQSTKTLDLLVQ